MSGDSSSLHHPLIMITKGEHSAFPVALALFVSPSVSAFRLVHIPQGLFVWACLLR